mgnify:FL=1
MNKLTVAIIGAGRIGQLHANNILLTDYIELKSIADINISHLQNTNLAKKIPIITTDTEDIFKDPDIDAVIICSSTNSHTELIKKAAYAGKHIFCEKPISFNIKETIEALNIVKNMGVKFQSGFNRRFDKNFRHVYNSVQNDKVGKPHIIKITSRDPEIPSEEYIKVSGGLFMDMTIHDFDMARYLAGSDVTEVSVKAANLIDPVFSKYNDVDTAITLLKFENGVLAVIDNSRRAVYGYDQRVEVFGSKGVVTAYNEYKTTVEIATENVTTSDNPKYFFLERYREAYIEEIKSFANAILYDQPIVCTGEDGFKAELLAHAAKLSLKENRTILMSDLLVNE